MNRKVPYTWKIQEVNVPELRLRVLYVPDDNRLTSHALWVSIHTHDNGSRYSAEEMKPFLQIAAPLTLWEAELSALEGEVQEDYSSIQEGRAEAVRVAPEEGEVNIGKIATPGAEGEV